MDAFVTVIVCPTLGPGCDETTLQAALDRSPDYVEMAPGQYPMQNVRVDVPDILIKSQRPAEPAVLTLAISAIGQAGPILEVAADNVVLRDLHFDGTSPSSDQVPFDARAVEIRGAEDVSLERITMQGFRYASTGSALLVENARASLYESTLQDGSASEFGGLVHARSTGAPTALRILGGTLRRGFAAELGGAVSSSEADLSIVNVTLTDNDAALKAGHVYVEGGTLELFDSRLFGGTAPQWQALDAQSPDLITLRRVEIGAPSTPSAGLVVVQDAAFVDVDELTMPEIGASGPGLQVIGSVVEIEDSVFADNTTENTPAVVLDGSDSALVQTSWFCNAGSVRGSLEMFAGCLGGCTVEDTFFVGNQSPEPMEPIPSPSGVALVANVFGPVVIIRNTFGANGGFPFTGSLIGVGADELTFTGNLLFDNVNTGPPLDLEVPGRLDVSGNAGTSSNDLIPEDPMGVVLPDRPIRMFQTAGRRQPDACRPLGPWLTDPDGPPPPFGAMVLDQDEDGWSALEDCDDEDEDVFPGAVEIVGDGVDQDCSNDETCLRDADEDGYGGPEVRVLDWTCELPGNTIVGGDCDDDDPSIHPGAIELPDDEIDSDCNGLLGPDEDLDGFDVNEDCDDADPTSYPGADDPLGDGIDQDCDGSDGIDRDGDGTPVPEDCVDDDPARTTCPSFFGGSRCATGSPDVPLLWPGLILLGLVRRPCGARQPPSQRPT